MVSLFTLVHRVRVLLVKLQTAIYFHVTNRRSSYELKKNNEKLNFCKHETFLSRSLPLSLHVFESLAPRNDEYRNSRSTSFAIDSIGRRYFTWSQQKRRKTRRFSSNYVYTVEHLIIYCVRNDPKANVYINSMASIAIRFVFISILMRHHIDVRQSTIPISLSPSIYNFCHIVSNGRDDEETSRTSKWIGRFCLMTKWLSFITFGCVFECRNG